MKEVVLSDIVLEEGLCPDAKWIGSLLQYLKDRQLTDIYTG